MIQEIFVTGDSLIHRFDPRLKVVFATLFAFVTALSMRFPTLFAALFVSFVLMFLARLDLTRVARRAALVNGLIFFFWMILPLTFGDYVLFHLGPFEVTREGVILSAQITLKSNAILFVFISLVASMPISTLGHALNRLMIPEKIVHLLLLTYRYIFVIEHEYHRLTKAAKVRGFRPRTNMHTYKTYAYFLGMLFVKSAARAERVNEAMLCRGFKGKFYCLSEFEYTKLDWIWASIMVALISGLVILECMKITC
jgi:cobalt/nickel transport system permease protein